MAENIQGCGATTAVNRTFSVLDRIRGLFLNEAILNRKMVLIFYQKSMGKNECGPNKFDFLFYS